MTDQQLLAPVPPETKEISRAASAEIDLARLAADPNVSVDKLEKLIELQERVMARLAEQAFNRDFALMQSKLPVVIERGRGDKQMSYALLEDIVETVRPVISEYGFSLRHETNWIGDDGKIMEVVGWLIHRDGHKVSSSFRTVADKSGSKNDVQALGSAKSYGRRYTTFDLLLIVSREDDDDGKRAGGKREQEEMEKPEGFDDWLLDLEATAEEGTNALEAVFQSSPKDKKRYLVATAKGKWEKIKEKAARKNK